MSSPLSSRVLFIEHAGSHDKYLTQLPKCEMALTLENVRQNHPIEKEWCCLTHAAISMDSIYLHAHPPRALWCILGKEVMQMAQHSLTWIEKLPMDILENIMNHLPMEVHARLECINKWWALAAQDSYSKRYSIMLEEERAKLAANWEKADIAWAECLDCYLGLGFGNAEDLLISNLNCVKGLQKAQYKKPISMRLLRTPCVCDRSSVCEYHNGRFTHGRWPNWSFP